MSFPLNILINDFALRSLRETADKDYVHARLAHRARLIPQFQWSSLHCLEKYTKCVLVLNRIDARSIRHEVEAGIALIGERGKFQIELSEVTLKFIRNLEDGARFRYYETSYHAQGIDLAKLDRAVWELRRYCQPLDYDIEVEGRSINLLEHNLSRIRAAKKTNESGTCIMGGWLEEVIRKPAHPSRQALVWRNLFFGKLRRTKVAVVNWLEAGNSPLYLHPEIVDEVEKYIFLPSDVKTAYRELYRKRLAGMPE